MKRIFCDVCGDEITEANGLSGGRKDQSKLGAEFKSGAAAFEVTVYSTRTDSDYCRNCIIEAFDKLKTRQNHASDS